MTGVTWANPISPMVPSPNPWLVDFPTDGHGLHLQAQNGHEIAGQKQAKIPLSRSAA